MAKSTGGTSVELEDRRQLVFASGGSELRSGVRLLARLRQTNYGRIPPILDET